MSNCVFEFRTDVASQPRQVGYSTGYGPLYTLKQLRERSFWDPVIIRAALFCNFWLSLHLKTFHYNRVQNRSRICLNRSQILLKSKKLNLRWILYLGKDLSISCVSQIYLVCELNLNSIRYCLNICFYFRYRYFCDILRMQQKRKTTKGTFSKICKILVCSIVEYTE